MQLTKAIPKIIWSILVILVSGCASQAKYFIPENLPALSNDMSRIVLTREKQLAGAASSVVFLDIGTKISPNAMMYMAGIDIEKILDVENFASTAGIGSGDILLWFNPKLVSPLKCGNSSENCMKYHSRWPKDGSGGFLYGGGLILSDEAPPWDEHWDKQIETITEKIRNNSLATIKVSETEGFNIQILESPRKYFPDSPPYMPIETLNPELYVVPEVNGYAVLGFYGKFDLTLKRLKAGWEKESVYKFRPINYGQLSRNVQVIGSTEVGDTLVWDRKPGIMRLGSAWFDALGFMPKNIKVEANKTYFLRYTTRLGQRWELTHID